MIPLVLSFFALVFAGSIPLQLHVDTRRSWAAELDRWHSPGLEAMPAPRRDLAEVWPVPVTDMDLPARWDTHELASVEGLSRVRPGRHRLGEAPGTDAQQVTWNSDTAQFWALIAFNDLDEPCSHCSAPEDGERAHAGCPGCCCPCGSVPALPEGVEGYAIAGRTR